jgi:hypothetical protein
VAGAHAPGHACALVDEYDRGTGILLPMWVDPGQVHRQLTEDYRRMGDEQLRELADDFRDLTEIAQQTLRDEMKTRGLGDPQAPIAVKRPSAINSATANDEETGWDLDVYRVPPAQGEDSDDASPAAQEYTWKTLLCECETSEQVWQLAEALRRAGIDSWSQSRGLSYPRILVAADQLDLARMIAAQPIPQDIVDASKADKNEEPQYFEMPHCPACGASDPVLLPGDEKQTPDSKDKDRGWVNRWQCGACGREWEEAEGASAAE